MNPTTLENSFNRLLMNHYVLPIQRMQQGKMVDWTAHVDRGCRDTLARCYDGGMVLACCSRLLRHAEAPNGYCLHLLGMTAHETPERATAYIESRIARQPAADTIYNLYGLMEGAYPAT